MTQFASTDFQIPNIGPTAPTPSHGGRDHEPAAPIKQKPVEYKKAYETDSMRHAGYDATWRKEIGRDTITTLRHQVNPDPRKGAAQGESLDPVSLSLLADLYKTAIDPSYNDNLTEQDVMRLVFELFRLSIQCHEESGELHRKLTSTEQTLKKKFDTERLAKMEKIYEELQKTEGWKVMGDLAAGMVTAIGAVGLGGVWAGVAIAIILALTFDSVCADPGKRLVADGIAHLTSWDESRIMTGLQILASVVNISTAIAIGIAATPTDLIMKLRSGAALAMATSQGHNAFRQYQASARQKNLKMIEAETTEAKEGLEKLVTHVKEYMEKMFDSWDEFRRVIEGQKNATSAMMR